MFSSATYDLHINSINSNSLVLIVHHSFALISSIRLTGAGQILMKLMKPSASDNTKSCDLSDRLSAECREGWTEGGCEERVNMPHGVFFHSA